MNEKEMIEKARKSEKYEEALDLLGKSSEDVLEEDVRVVEGSDGSNRVVFPVKEGEKNNIRVNIIFVDGEITKGVAIEEEHTSDTTVEYSIKTT